MGGDDATDTAQRNTLGSRGAAPEAPERTVLFRGRAINRCSCTGRNSPSMLSEDLAREHISDDLMEASIS